MPGVGCLVGWVVRWAGTGGGGGGTGGRQHCSVHYASPEYRTGHLDVKERLGVGLKELQEYSGCCCCRRDGICCPLLLLHIQHYH